MPKDHEWTAFVENDDHFVDPRTPVREVQNIQYPGRDNELAQEVRAGLMERKSKYLKSMCNFPVALFPWLVLGLYTTWCSLELSYGVKFYAVEISFGSLIPLMQSNADYLKAIRLDGTCSLQLICTSSSLRIKLRRLSCRSTFPSRNLDPIVRWDRRRTNLC